MIIKEVFITELSVVILVITDAIRFLFTCLKTLASVFLHFVLESIFLIRWVVFSFSVTLVRYVGPDLNHNLFPLSFSVTVIFCDLSWSVYNMFVVPVFSHGLNYFQRSVVLSEILFHHFIFMDKVKIRC